MKILNFNRYDILIISPGASPLKVIKGSEKYPTMKKIFDAIPVKDHLKIAFGRYHPLISIIGGGAIGVGLTT